MLRCLSCRLEVEVEVEGGSSATLEGLAVQAVLYRCNEAGEVDATGVCPTNLLCCASSADWQAHGR